MRIGIISCDGWLLLWDNYGTLFQNYALQTYLRKRGHETFWILTRSEKRSLKEVFLRVFFRPKTVLSFARSVFVSQVIRRKERVLLERFNVAHPRSFNLFFNKYIPHTEQRYSDADLIQSPPSANCYIVGSDQVWSGVTVKTFLGFGEKHALRIAYAVSTSWKNKDGAWLGKAREMLPVFNDVSVREPEGLDVCTNAGRSDAVHVCDPTLLLEKEDYLKVVQAEGADAAFPKKTVLAYFLNIKKLSELPWNAVVEFAQNREADLKVVPLQGAELAIPEEYVYTPSPAEWLNAYDKADCILTNSFHGTAFAIIMRKPFLVVLQKGKTEGENCRFFSILKKLGLESRIFDSSKGKIAAQMDEAIDWDCVAEKLNAFRSFSRQFLEKALCR